ncbi:MAG: hypothetical protein NT166_01390 [Candidatus Aminicenantes bacterium]|nr:hypothetical protein [Candidatus Aminicenantes bacterium]
MAHTDFSRRTSLNDFHKILSTSHPPWREIHFKIAGPSDYNEYIYFYDFAQDALFPNEKNIKTLRQYEYKIESGKPPVYKIKPIDAAEPYELTIEKILLTTYFTGVGILSFHLVNYKYLEFQDILRVNEYGRRIYPQFLDAGTENLIGSTKKAFLADSLEVCIDDTGSFKEDFSYFDAIEKVNSNPNMLSNTIIGLLGRSFYTGELEEAKEGIHISPILDDRMFVLCWLADKSLCCKLAKYNKESETYGYAENDDWFKLVFVDKEYPYCTSIPMKKKLLMEHTYDRWIRTKWSSLFGITRYSFILLNDKQETFVKDHLKTMYFQMVKLALVQQASILRFSGEATRIAELEEPENTTERVSVLQKKYLQFINKIYFREITAFEQGIDLYEKIVQAMQIERDVKELDQEIEELHHYASLQEEKRKNNLLKILSIFGSIFLVPAFISGFFGMNVFSNELGVGVPGRLLTIVGVMLIACIISWFLITKHNKIKKVFSVILVVIEVFIIGMLISGCLFTLIGV